MAIKLRASNTEAREMVPEGTYKGVLVGIYDIGTQTGLFGERHQVVLSFELFKKGLPKPLTINKFYGLSFHVKSSLRQDIEAMTGRTYKDGEELDLEGVLETPCRIQIGRGQKKDGTPKDEIKSLMPLDEDEARPKPYGNITFFEIDRAGCDIPSEVPGWIADMVRRSSEWTGNVTSEPIGAKPGNGRHDDDDSESPF